MTSHSSARILSQTRARADAELRAATLLTLAAATTFQPVVGFGGAFRPASFAWGGGGGGGSEGSHGSHGGAT